MLTTKPDEQSKYQTSFDARDTEATTASSSIAGAGSGDFHTYRKLKRKEMERLSQLEREAKEKQEKEIFERQRLERIQKEEEKTLKRYVDKESPLRGFTFLLER